MLTCPHGQQRAMSVWGKMNLSALWGSECLACGKRVYASWGSPWVVGLSIFAGAQFANHVPSRGWAYAALAAACFIGLLVQAYALPLVRRDTLAKGKA